MHAKRKPSLAPPRSSQPLRASHARDADGERAGPKSGPRSAIRPFRFEADDGAAPTPVPGDPKPEPTGDSGGGDVVDVIFREMYTCYLKSEYPQALQLAECVGRMQPGNLIAQAVRDRARGALGLRPGAVSNRVTPDTVLMTAVPLRTLKCLRIDPVTMLVLERLDGVKSVRTIVERLPLRAHEVLEVTQALDRLLGCGVVLPMRARGACPRG
jgi:hypothetical protein